MHAHAHHMHRRSIAVNTHSTRWHEKCFTHVLYIGYLLNVPFDVL